MGNSIRDALISTPRMVAGRDTVTRVVVEGKEDGCLVGTLAQAEGAQDGRDGYPN